jgi:hypothetical protein
VSGAGDQTFSTRVEMNGGGGAADGMAVLQASLDLTGVAASRSHRRPALGDPLSVCASFRQEGDAYTRPLTRI